MGCGQSKTVIPGQSELINEQSDQVKHQMMTAIRKDDPILFNSILENHNVSLKEQLNDGFDTNWTMLHFAASKNASKIIENFLVTKLSQGQLSFDIVNARDIAGKTPLEVAHNYSCFEAFITLLQTCTTYQHRVNISSDLINSVEKDSDYMQAIKEYKSQAPASKETVSAKTDLVQKEGDCLIIFNRGNSKEDLSAKVKELGQNNQFKDKEFPGNDTSQTTWIHVKDLLHQDFKIYSKGGFNSNGEVSSVNPNLNSLLCAFNEFPNCINRILTSLQHNEQGYTAVTLYHNGQPKLILLDEYFPASKTKENLLYQKPFNNEIWPQIIEKGLAKAYGSYTKISKLDLSELLETTLGAPVKTLKVSNHSIDIFWMTLQDLEQSRCITFAKSKLAGDSCFLLESIYSVNEKRMIRLKACFPKAKVEQAINDNSLDEEIRRVVGYETKENGWYFIELENFVNQFEEITVSYYNQSWNRTAIVMPDCAQKARNFTFELRHDTKLALSLSQAAEEDGAACPLHFVLIQKEGSDIKTMAEGDSHCKTGSKTCYVDDEKEISLQAGKYVVQIKAHTKAKKVNVQGTLVLYSPQFIPISPSVNKKLLEDVFISLGKANNLKEPCGVRCEFTSGWWSTYYWLYFENNSDKKWDIAIKFEDLTNLKVGKPFRVGTNSLQVIVEAGQKKIAYLQKKNPAKEADVKLDMNHTFE